MEREQLSWKGHAVTLFIFTGIVVLCSIFFILGMLAGRAQGQKLASQAAAAAPASPVPAELPPPVEDEPEFTFDKTASEEPPQALQPPVEAPRLEPAPKPEPEAKPKVEPKTPPAPKPAKAADPPPAKRSGGAVNYQVGAVRKSADAERLLAELKKKGFRGFIMAPPPKDPNPFYRVQVGPFADVAEAQPVRKKLESAGYKPILKK